MLACARDRAGRSSGTSAAPGSAARSSACARTSPPRPRSPCRRRGPSSRRSRSAGSSPASAARCSAGSSSRSATPSGSSPSRTRCNLVAIAVIGGLGSLAGAVTGALWVVGLPAFWPNNQTVLLFTSSIGLLIILLYFPGGFTQIGYWLRGSMLDWLEKRLPPVPTKTSTAAAGVAHARRGDPPAARRPTPTAACSRTHGLTVRFGGIVAVDARRLPRRARRGDRPHRHERRRASRRCSTRSAASCRSDGTVELLGRDVSHALRAPARPRTGSAARSRPRRCSPS